MSVELNEHLTCLFPSGSPQDFTTSEKERMNFRKVMTLAFFISPLHCVQHLWGRSENVFCNLTGETGSLPKDIFLSVHHM